ncbi:MAG: DNA-3-methyladenine glycosylase I [Myxococcota bacterium]
MEGLVEGADGRCRCAWGASTADYVAYHDEEWGRPVGSDARLLEKLCLEGFQSGLSWLTILRKRAAFRAAFAEFDASTLAQWGPTDVERLLTDAGIVRHRGKIEAVLTNARATLAVQRSHGSLAAFVWAFEPPPEELPPRMDLATLRSRATTPASLRLSKALKRAGFTFVGPTTAQAFQQAMGMVDDHLDGCWVRAEVERERATFVRPEVPSDPGGGSNQRR